MKFHWFWMFVSIGLKFVATLLACYMFATKVVRNLNEWYYDLKLRNKEYPLPPADMGWPIIGNIWPFFKYFSFGEPDTFINNIVQKYGRSGIYKTHLYGSPSIIVTAPVICKKVLTDDVNFKHGYPKATNELTRNRFLTKESVRFKRLLMAPMVGYSSLAMYLECIEDIVINKLENLSSMKHPIEFLKEMREARKKLVKVFHSIIDERRMMVGNGQIGEKKYLLDNLLEMNDKMGEKLENGDIIDFFITLMFGGHETTALTIMWTTIYLTQNPLCLKKATEEQKEIMKARPSSQKRLCIKEIKNMVYLSQVVDETLRRINNVFAAFRETTTDVNINGYFIPKGWKVIVWLRGLHMDSDYHSNPTEFNPSRWDTLLPFGTGRRVGSDLARFEIAIFLHHFLLNYRLERINPESPINYLPTPEPKDYCLAKVIKLSGVTS